MFNMNINQIEILKLGSITTTKQANNLRRLNIVCDGGPIFDYYKYIIIQNTSNIFEFYETSKIFVGGPLPYNDPTRLFGTLDEKPLVGKPLGLTGEITKANQTKRWYSSRIDLIIENYIIITKNSVYVIHDISSLRNQKLGELGI